MGSTHSGGELRKKLEFGAQEEEEKPLPKRRGVSRKNSMKRESFANIEPLMIDTAKAIQQRDFLKGGNTEPLVSLSTYGLNRDIEALERLKFLTQACFNVSGIRERVGGERYRPGRDRGEGQGRAHGLPRKRS